MAKFRFLIRIQGFNSPYLGLINPFFPNAPFLYPTENIRKPCGFLMFSGLEQGCIGNEWVKKVIFVISDQRPDFRVPEFLGK